MSKKYYLRENGKNIPFTFEELKNKKLKKNTKIWIEGASSWQRLDRIPELNEISDNIIESKSNYVAVIITCFLLISSVIGYVYYINYYLKEQKKVATQKKIVLKKMDSKELFNKYQNSVVLIKHSFLYKVKLGSMNFYFRDYNKETGEISELKSLDELKDSLNTIWGSGFFINKKGDVITNRHIVEVKPSEEDQNKILKHLKSVYNNSYQSDSVRENRIINRLDEIKYTTSNIDLTDYEYSNIEYEYNTLLEELKEVEFSKSFNKFVLDLHSLPNNFVTKSSFEFGIFFNHQKSTNYKDYIKYKSQIVSKDELVDLALLSVVNNNDLLNKMIAPVDLTLFDSINLKPRQINDKVIMIAFNRGSYLADTSNGFNAQLTEGNISQINDDHKILYTIPALPGSSGAPVFDIYGRLISVNFAGLVNTQSFNYGIQTKSLYNFLNLIKSKP